MLNSQFSSDENWELVRLTVQTRREASRLNKRTMKHAELTDDLQERASLYAAGAMPENERREYAQHLEEERCPVCTKEVDELQSLMSLFDFSTPLQSPSPAIGESLMEQSRRCRVYVHNLPPVPSDRSYQLWFVPRTGNPISASVFNTETDGSAMVDIPGPDNVVMLAAAAVTTEPAGGLPQPSGPFALLGMV